MHLNATDIKTNIHLYTYATNERQRKTEVATKKYIESNTGAGEYKIGISPTSEGKIFIGLLRGMPSQRTIEILPKGVGDFPILYFSGV